MQLAKEPKGQDRRSIRYAQRETLRRITALPRHHICGRRPIPDRPVQLRLALSTDGDPVAHYSGLQMCGAIWTCPVCSPKIRQHRAVEADQAAATWLDTHGSGSLLMLTLTLPHDVGERLVDVLASTRRSFSSLVSGRAWKADKQIFGIRHYIRAHDVTVGANGWHPHLHLLLFVDRALEPWQLAALRQRIFERWSASVTSLCRRAPTLEHGVVIEVARSREEATNYICQVVTGSGDSPNTMAYELTRGDLKMSRHNGQRTPWQVLDDYGSFRANRDRLLWLEYERATRRVNAIRWSNGLRAAVHLDVAEQTDEQIVLQEVGSDVVHTFDELDWQRIRDAKGLYEHLVRSELLTVAELAGADGVRSYLAVIRRTLPLDEREGRRYRPSGAGTRNRRLRAHN